MSFIRTQNNIPGTELTRWFSDNVWRLVFSFIAIVVVLILSLLMKVIVARVRKSTTKRSYTVIKLVESIIKYLIFIILIFVILGIWGIDVTSALIGFALMLVVVGFGAQDLIKDVIAGIGIIIGNQYDIDEVIEVDGFKGKVIEISLRTTKLTNTMGETKIIRNGTIVSLTNFSKLYSVALVDLELDYFQDIEKITKILDDNLPSLKNSYSQIIEGPVVIGVVSMQNGVIKLRVSAKTEPEEHYSVKRALLKSIKQILDSNNIEMYTANKKEAENDK